eukprot:c5117_g1_i1.p1 GENE.c5117_g1_i1~~c5117_g1_i1.p1  ORF type:complete len:557 (-),score=134.50 c5117_g1_i1:67-1701(-)
MKVVVLGLLFASSLAIAAQEILTTNAGAPIDNYKNSLTVGPRGAILLQDVQLIERLQIHNRERIPERNVHARGATAKGTFLLTHDFSDSTIADLFSDVGKATPVACRWSTVIHSVGSPEFLRDPRGFAVKFYTQQGNYDIVGLSFPVFFIRDGIRFPDMIRSLKPNPRTGVQEWWRIWDYFSNYPESLHMFTWLMDDVGIPLSYRHLDGWGVHTFKWLNAIGQSTLVRYYWKSHQGVKSLDDDDAVKQPFSFATTDLYESIETGDFPQWTLYVQRIPESNSTFINSLPFDVLDTTKQWPTDIIPLEEVGVVTFNQNVNSQFLENEQIAFSPGRLVPGIEPSDEKMLQTRVFAYSDTQRYRLGTNYQMLPINRPKCPFRDAHVDGAMNFLDPAEDHLSSTEINYFPSTINTQVSEANPFPHDPEVLNANKTKTLISKTDDYQQPGDRYRSFDADRQDRFAKRVASALSDNRMDATVLNKWLDMWTKVDAGLANKIRQYLTALRSPSAGGSSKVGSLTPASPVSPGLRDELLRFKHSFLRASGSSA